MAAEKTDFVVDPDSPTIVATRTFNAPRRIVFQAFTNPDFLPQWYGPNGYTVTSADADLHPGGAYHIVNRSPDGKEYAFKGEYQEIVRPERLVYTWIFEGMPDKGAQVIDVFEDRNGRTTLTSTTTFQSIADRDAFVATGANEGAAQSMDRMALLLRSMT